MEPRKAQNTRNTNGRIAMAEGETKINDRDLVMHHREITLEDGRYMIFYTFGDDVQNSEEEREQDV